MNLEIKEVFVTVSGVLFLRVAFFYDYVGCTYLPEIKDDFKLQKSILNVLLLLVF